MIKCFFLAAVIVIAGSATSAFAKPRRDTAYLRSLCDRALAARGRADAPAAVRERCVALLRARLAARQTGQRRVLCYRMLDPNQRGWSMDAHDFARFHGQQVGPCPGM
jgi:hypothetical protein